MKFRVQIHTADWATVHTEPGWLARWMLGCEPSDREVSRIAGLDDILVDWIYVDLILSVEPNVRDALERARAAATCDVCHALPGVRCDVGLHS